VPVLMELLAIRLGYQKTIAKSLVMSLSKRPAGISNIAGSTRKRYAVVVKGLKPQQHTQRPLLHLVSVFPKRH
jgi:hypothetical protein